LFYIRANVLCIHTVHTIHIIVWCSVCCTTCAAWDVLMVLVVVCALVTIAEAVTQENDNVVLPLYACILLLSFLAYICIYVVTKSYKQKTC